MGAPEAGLATSHSEGAIEIPLVPWLGGRENLARARPSRALRGRGGFLWAWGPGGCTLFDQLLGQVGRKFRQMVTGQIFLSLGTR